MILPAGPAFASGQRDRWVEARRGPVAVVADAGEEPAREVLAQLQRMQTMLGQIMPDSTLDPRKPVVILAVHDERGVRELLPQFWERRGQRPVAAYWGGPHRHCIVVRLDAPEPERHRRILHEYVHLLAHEQVPGLPAWLDEGLSEFWATAVVEDDRLEIGRPAPQHLRVLRARRSWIPFDTLLTMERAPGAGDRRRLALFYAQSWALVHYLMLGGSSNGAELAPSGYVNALREADDAGAGARAALGGAESLERTVAEYIRGARFLTRRIDVGLAPDIFGDAEVRLPPSRSARQRTGEPDVTYIRTLSVAQSLAVRAACVADGERAAAAVPLLAAAVAADPDDASVLETLGYVHFQQNHPVDAAAWFDRAIASGSASHLAYFYRTILAGPVPTPVPAEDYLRRSIDLEPGFAAAYARLAGLYTEDRPDEAVPLLRRATALEPDNAAYSVELGRLLVRLNRPAEARKVAADALAAAPSASSRGLLLAFLRDLGN